MADPFVVELHLGRSRQWVVLAHHFEIAAVPRPLLLNHHDTVKRLFLGAETRQSDHEHLCLLSLITPRSKPGVLEIPKNRVAQACPCPSSPASCRENPCCRTN